MKDTGCDCEERHHRRTGTEKDSVPRRASSEEAKPVEVMSSETNWPSASPTNTSRRSHLAGGVIALPLPLSSVVRSKCATKAKQTNDGVCNYLLHFIIRIIITFILYSLERWRIHVSTSFFLNYISTF